MTVLVATRAQRADNTPRIFLATVVLPLGHGAVHIILFPQDLPTTIAKLQNSLKQKKTSATYYCNKNPNLVNSGVT